MTAFLSDFPELVDQWDLTKNGNLTPQNIVAGSGKKVWWKCPKGEDHEWVASPDQRKKVGVPIVLIVVFRMLIIFGVYIRN